MTADFDARFVKQAGKILRNMRRHAEYGGGCSPGGGAGGGIARGGKVSAAARVTAEGGRNY